MSPFTTKPLLSLPCFTLKSSYCMNFKKDLRTDITFMYEWGGGGDRRRRNTEPKELERKSLEKNSDNPFSIFSLPHT